jgi:hypothetical protein
MTRSPFRSQQKFFYTYLQEIIEKATKIDDIILAGDFNAITCDQPVEGCVG